MIKIHYDKNMVIDTTNLPKDLKEIINELEKLYEKDDWFNYDIKFYLLDVLAKSHAISNRITDEEYNKNFTKVWKFV